VDRCINCVIEIISIEMKELHEKGNWNY